MWGVSRHLMGHTWSDMSMKKTHFENSTYYHRFGDDLVMPDPRGSADTEEQFLEKYEDVIK